MRLWVLTAAVLIGSPPLLANQDVTPAQLEALKEEISDINEWLSDAESDRSELEQQLIALDRQISQLTRERRNLRRQSLAQQETLVELDKREAELVNTLDSQRDALKRQIRAAWIEGDAPAIKVLLNEIDPEKIGRTMTYYEYLSRDTVERLERFRANLRELNATRQQVNEAKAKLASLERDIQQRQSQLSERKNDRQRTLTALRSDIKDRLNQRQQLEQDREQLEKLLREVEEAIANIPSPNESAPFKSLRSKLPWPVSGKVVASYGQSYADGRMKHNGVLVQTDGETEIEAVHYGRVVFANWLRGFGLMTIIDHGDGYLTLYGHSSSLFTSPGDWVSPGQPIALSGQTGGTEQPSLYFEVRQNGKPQNPGRWLSRR